MAEQQTAHGLSPQLGAVLSSLNISLEAELNRYRRDRRSGGLVRADIFADVENDPSFDVETVKAAFSMALPPVPPNKKLLATQTCRSELPVSGSLALRASTQPVSNELSDEPVDRQLGSHSPQVNPQVNSKQANNSDLFDTSISALISPMVKPVGAKTPGEKTASGIVPAAIAPSSYLTSSEKLIESLENTSLRPNPTGIASGRPRRKTVSLVAGAILGFFGLAAGLCASYLMSNPLVAQRLASGLQGDRADLAATPKAFDPPGPDLSGAEFVELEIDNLSSLQMPQTPLINPSNLPPTPAIPSGLESSVPNDSTVPPTNIPAPAAPSSMGTQAVVLPVGLTYYVTVPFTSERDLRQIRESISEAFVRQFSAGNRIQIAAFDNAESAQQFIEELKEKNIKAEVYGPTTE